MSELLLGIDVGTTALKAVVLDPQRGIIARAERPHTLTSLQPGWAEEDPGEWWSTTISTVRELVAAIPLTDIAAVGVTGMAPAMVLLDDHGAVLRPSVQQNDARAIVEVAELHGGVDAAEFLNRTGGVPNQQNVDPRWRWLAKHEPRMVEQCATLCGSYDYITGKLSGARSLEANWAAESGLYDIRARAWIPEYLAHAGIDPGVLPPVHAPTDIVGQIDEAAAGVTGLRAGTPVIAGSADHVAAALAAGLTASGDVLLKFGGAGDILAVVDGIEPDPHFYFDYHDVPGLALINGCMASSGSLLRWYARELAGDTPLDILDREAAEIPPGAGGIVALPYALGEKTPIFDPEARAVFAGVMLHHTRAHVYRSLLEAVCFGFAHHLDLLRSAGRPVQRILAADGGSRSALWMQIAADIVGEPVQVVSGDAASAIGVAFVAGMSVGVFSNWGEVLRFAVHGPRYDPDQRAVERYRQGYGVYRELYERLRTLFPLMRGLDAPLP